jgi:hypothetical protein
MFRRLNRLTFVSLAGLLVGIVGLLVQWAADPSKFSAGEQPFGIAFPPGILFILGAGLLTLGTARWWWHSAFAVLISFWIVVVGGLAGQLTPNLFSPNLGTVAGNLIMTVGLALAGIAGVLGMIRARRSGRSRVDR